MKSESVEKQNDFFVLGNRLFVNFRHKEKTRIDENGNEITSWVCDQVILPKNSSRAEMIEAIIRNDYHSYGAELSAINTGGDTYNTYLEHRELAKFIADSYFGVSE